MKSTSRLSLLFLLFILLNSSPAFAQTIAQPADLVVLSNGQDRYPLGRHLEILRDPSGELTIQDVTSAAYLDQFTPSQVETPNFGFQKAVYWARFRVRNQAEQNSSWVLQLGFVNMHYVDLYLPSKDGASYLAKQSGVLRPYENRDFPFRYLAFNLSLPPGSEQTVYLRFQNQASMTLSLILWSRSAFTRFMLLDQWASGIFFGALIIMGLYNLLLWYLIRERSYLYLALFIASVLGSDFFYFGIAYQFVQFHSARLATSSLLVFLGLLIFFILRFVIELLDLKTISPKLCRASNYFGGVLILTVLLAPFGPYQLIGVTQLILGMILLFAIFIYASYRVRAGSRTARYLLVSWIWYIFAGILFALTRMGLLSSTLFSEHSNQAALLWMVVVWSIALADRVNTLKDKAETTSRRLRASESRLSQFLEAVPVGVVVYGTDLKPRFINQEAQRLLTSPAMGFYPDLSPEKTLEETRDYFSFRVTGSEQIYPLERLPLVRALGGKPASADDVEIDLGGERIPTESWASPLFDPEGKITGAVVAFQDIRERLQKEALLRESQEMRRLAVEAAGLGIWSNDLVTGEVRWDARTREIFGVEPDEPASLELGFSLIHPEDRAKAQEAFERAIAPESDGLYLEQKRIVRPDGQVRWISTRGEAVFEGRGADRRAVRLAGIVMDVTRGKRAEQALEESLVRYRRLVETMNEGLGVSDENDRFAYVNPRLAEMLGYSPDEMFGRPVVEFFDQQNRAIIADQLARRRAGEQEPYTITWCRKDGGDLHTLVAPAGVFDQAGKYLRSIAVVTDISEQVRASQLLDQRVAERTHELQTLLEVSQVVVSTLGLERLLQVILEQLKSVIDFSGAAMYSLADRHLSTLNVPLLVEQEKAAFLAEPLVRSLSSNARFAHGEAIIVPDVGADTAEGRTFRRLAAGVVDLDSGEVRAWMGVPLTVKEKLIGILSLHHNQPDYYRPEHARLASAFANQAAVAIENARLYRQAQTAAVAKERSRLARELHDSVTQALYGLTLYGGATHAALRAGKLEVAEKNLDELVAVAREGMGDLRLLIFELHPPILEQEGLVGALRTRLEAVEARAGVQKELYVDGEPELSLEVETELYWSVHEALNNVLKHARAQHVYLDLRFQNGSAAITLRDDGAGFDTSTLPQSNGMGLKNVADRVEKLGGSFKIESKPGEGTVFEIKLEE